MSVLNQTYSDFYKGVHGFRPRQSAFTSVEQAQKAIDDLDDYYVGLARQEEIDAARQSEIEKEREDATPECCIFHARQRQKWRDCKLV